MKLIRVGNPGSEKPGVLVDHDQYIDVSAITQDFDEQFFGTIWQHDLQEYVADQRSKNQSLPLQGLRIGAPIARPHQIICVGLNYSDHAAETGLPIPHEPILFSKSPNTLIGPYDDVIQPPGSSQLDWEVELAIVIGKQAKYLPSVAAAREHIAGLMVVNDVSERDFQLNRSGQWLKGKSAETFNPAGPWLVTLDEIENIHNLSLWLKVNEVTLQDSSTAQMIFDPFTIVHYISQFLVLEPGDIINTGTPAGVGMGFNPPRWLNPGDTMELGIEQLGIQKQTVKSHHSA